jgi:non-homologous end joining protein Ku
LPERPSLTKATISKFERLITARTERQLSAKDVHDEGTDQLLKLAKSKKSRHQDIVEVEEEKATEDNVVDLMEVPEKKSRREGVMTEVGSSLDRSPAVSRTPADAKSWVVFPLPLFLGAHHAPACLL